MEIRIDDLNGPEIRHLLAEHLRGMYEQSPPECVHALDLTALQQPDITFWSVWQNGALHGCGALKQLDTQHAEIKSMRTASAHLRKGVAKTLLQHILGEAKARGYQKLSLETGTTEGFKAARNLYVSLGFTECGPFADYTLDPFSVFMSKTL